MAQLLETSLATMHAAGEAWQAYQRQLEDRLTTLPTDLARGISPEAIARAIEAAFLKAYRWQYILSGAEHPKFGKVLSSLVTASQGQRIDAAFAALSN